jgi:hypothetical protein
MDEKQKVLLITNIKIILNYILTIFQEFLFLLMMRKEKSLEELKNEMKKLKRN